MNELPDDTFVFIGILENGQPKLNDDNYDQFKNYGANADIKTQLKDGSSFAMIGKKNIGTDKSPHQLIKDSGKGPAII